MNKVLRNHVIQSEQVPDEELCRLKCYLEPNCMSYNYGPLNDESFLCELNDKSHSQTSPNELNTRDGFIYRPIFKVNRL